MFVQFTEIIFFLSEQVYFHCNFRKRRPHYVVLPILIGNSTGIKNKPKSIGRLAYGQIFQQLVKKQHFKYFFLFGSEYQLVSGQYIHIESYTLQTSIHIENLSHLIQSKLLSKFVCFSLIGLMWEGIINEKIGLSS